MASQSSDREEAELRREREIQRALSAHESEFAKTIWADLWAAPSKSTVDSLAYFLLRDQRHISPRLYETFDDADFRDAICRKLGRPYDELPNVGPAQRDIGWTVLLWYFGTLGAIAVSAIIVALVRTLLGL